MAAGGASLAAPQVGAAVGAPPQVGGAAGAAPHDVDGAVFSDCQRSTSGWEADIGGD